MSSEVMSTCLSKLWLGVLIWSDMYTKMARIRPFSTQHTSRCTLCTHIRKIQKIPKELLPKILLLWTFETRSYVWKLTKDRDSHPGLSHNQWGRIAKPIHCSELLLNPIEIPICAEIMWNYSLKSQILLNPHFCCWKHVKVPSCNLR